MALVPAEANLAVLAARIAGNVTQYLRLAGADERMLRHLLAQLQRRDFAEAHTVSVNGWLLSRTEARLCAIAALERRRTG